MVVLCSDSGFAFGTTARAQEIQPRLYGGSVRRTSHSAERRYSAATVAGRQGANLLPLRGGSVRDRTQRNALTHEANSQKKSPVVNGTIGFRWLNVGYTV